MAGINVQMGVTGASQFISSMNQSGASVKALNAALKLNEQQFKATGDKETYVSQKTSLLNQKIEAQKKVVESLNKSLEAMKKGMGGREMEFKSFRDMKEKADLAQASLESMQLELANVGKSAEEASTKTDTLNDSVNSIGTKLSLQQVIGGIDRITGGLESAARKAVQLGTKIVNAFLDAGHYADDLASRAVKLGVTEEQLQRMDYAERFLETSAETITTAQRRMSTNLYDIASQSEETVGYLTELGLVVSGKNGVIPSFTNLDEAFWKTGAAIAAMDDEIKKNAVANAIWGRGWSETSNLFAMSAEDMEKYGTGWEGMMKRYDDIMQKAPTNSEDAIDNLKKFDDAVQNLTAQFEGLKTELMGQLSPALTTVAESLAGVLKQFNEYLKTDEGKEKMKQFGESIEKLFEGIGDIDFAEAIDKVKAAIDSLQTALNWIIDNKDSVVSAMEGIVKGWAGLKLAGGALRVLELINGIKGLTGGGAQKIIDEFGSGASKTDDMTDTVKKVGLLETIRRGVQLAKTRATEMSGQVNTLMAQTGNFFPILGDWFTHNTSLGRTVTGQQTWSDLKKDADEYFESVHKNAETFEEDWKQNNLVKFMNTAGDKITTWWDGYKQKGEQAIEEVQTKIDDFNAFGAKHRPKTIIDAIVNPDPIQKQLDETKLTVPVTPVIDWTANESWAWRVGSGGYIRNVPGGIGTGAYAPSMRANGLPFVPFDNYPALLHKGERVVPANQNTYNAHSNLYVENMNMNNGADAQSLISMMEMQQRRISAGFGG